MLLQRLQQRVCFFCGGALDTQVELHFRFGAGGADAHPGVVFQLVIQHVGLGQVGGGDGPGGQVQDGVLQIIPDFQDFAVVTATCRELTESSIC